MSRIHESCKIILINHTWFSKCIHFKQFLQWNISYENIKIQNAALIVAKNMGQKLLLFVTRKSNEDKLPITWWC
jgi:hypothetical protein